MPKLTHDILKLPGWLDKAIRICNASQQTCCTRKTACQIKSIGVCCTYGIAKPEVLPKIWTSVIA